MCQFIPGKGIVMKYASEMGAECFLLALQSAVKFALPTASHWGGFLWLSITGCLSYIFPCVSLCGLVYQKHNSF